MPVLLVAVALVSGAAGTAGPTGTKSTQLVEIFQSTCMSREMKLSVDAAKPISYDKLPEGVPQGREQVGQPVSAEVWQLNTPGRTYVYILRFHEIPGIVAERVCGLASDKLNREAAEDWVLAKSDWSEGQLRWPIVWNMRQGYLLQAAEQARFGVLQVNWASEASRDQLLKSRH